MKNKTKILGLIATTFAMFVTSVNAASINNQIIDNNTLLLNNYQTELAHEVDTILKSDNETVYPSYYGGMYISDDSKNLIVQIVEKNIPLESNNISATEISEFEKYNKITTIDQNIQVEYVDNSYEELNAINKAIINYFSSDYTEYDNLRGNYIDTFNNVVVVELIENNQEQQRKFKELVIDSDLIVFTQLNEENEDYATTIKAGQGITTKGVSNNCSMGWRVKINGNAGYITAAHCFNGTGDSATGGTVTKYKRSGSVDAAFVQTTSSYSPSNSLYYTSGSVKTLNATLCPFLAVNTAVAKAGVTTGYTSGKIKSLDYSGTYSGIYFTGLIATDVEAAGGDSGGAVFTTSLVDGTAPVAGIVKGSSSYGMAFVDANDIYAAFGYTRY